jgi:rhodanese-related sulfurtransferase
MQNKYSYERHQRQPILKNFGEAGQLKANTGKSIGREPDEMPQVSAFSYKKIPLSKLEDCINGYEKEIVVFFCQSGLRSLRAVQWPQARNENKKTIFSLQGGILNYLRNQ